MKYKLYQATLPSSIDKYKDIIKKETKVSLANLKFLDGGAQAQIYEIKNTNLILKVTGDYRDAKFCRYLQLTKPNRPYLPKIKFVYKISRGPYLICMEKLDLITSNPALDGIILSGMFSKTFSDDFLKLLKKRGTSQTYNGKFCIAACKFLTYLKTLKVTQYDFHRKNVMRRIKTDDFVFIDYGYLEGWKQSITIPQLRN